jgi:decaprenylphospho-beta-D-ribofuranose 2-oxidase
VASIVDASVTELPALLASAGPRGLIARGLGRSYGDAAQNAGGTVLMPLTGALRIESGDHGTVVHVPAGQGLHELMAALLDQGLFVPVTPGTRYVTVGGAVACDIHGKNHHRDGTFGDHVSELDLMLADGTVRTIGPDRDADLFWATVGGMGLTGVITRVVLRVVPVETAFMNVHTERIADLDSLMRRMRDSDDQYPYSVAWIDTLARGRSMGRSVLTRARHARLDELSGSGHRHPLAPPGRTRLSVPFPAPAGLISRPTVRVFNEVWFRRAPRDRRDGLESIAAYFHPLDGLGNWNRLYGRRGLVQYQLVVPQQAENAMVEALRIVSEHGAASFLAVLKRFGPANRGLLSFPMSGWTLALDLAASPELAGMFHRLDGLVAEAGGRVYLAKDSRLPRSTFEAMYPEAEHFRAVRTTVDPGHVFQSDLSRRLGL